MVMRRCPEAIDRWVYLLARRRGLIGYEEPICDAS